MSGSSGKAPRPGQRLGQRVGLHLLAGPVLAVRFLTRLPVPLTGGQPVDMGAAVGWFPLAGALVGLFAGLADEMLGLFLPAPVPAAAAVAAALLATGALHLDGLMDTADGLSGARGDRERALAIMRDSRVGAAGAAAGAMALLLRYTLYLALSPAPPLGRAGFIVAAASVGRWGLVLAAYGRAPARAGLGSQLHAGLTSRRVLGAGVLGLVVAMGGAGLVRGFLSFALASALAAALAGWLGRRLGGYTGDTLGATGEVTELVALAVLAAHWPPAG